MTGMIDQISRRPILATIGALMSAIVVLAVLSMASSVIIAETNEGMAGAINQSGSLRMQSYRIGVALADESLPAAQRAETAGALATEFESRLESPRLVNAIPGHTADGVGRQYARITALWEGQMKPPLAEHIRLLGGDAGRESQALPRAQYLAGVDAFVAEIDQLVGQLEEVAERRIDLLRALQAMALVLTVTIVVITMALVLRRVIRPLAELLACADRVRRGDFSGRIRFTGNDELGRLGAAVNLMAKGLSTLYGDLEQRVAEKTRDLARSKHSLELLYRVSKRLNEEPVSERLLQRLLGEISDELGTGAATLCLQPDGSASRGLRLVTTRARGADDGGCWEQGCRACMGADRTGLFDLGGPGGGRTRVMSFPVADQDHRFGVLLVELRQGRPLAPWHERLLVTLAGHIGTALNLQQRMRESRRLVLHEERSIIARELHDSLAQSLSYLKIQVTRLSAAIETPDGSEKAKAVLAELREGVSSAYRQLRELLTTFRLRMDDRGLSRALEETAEEFRARSTLAIHLDNRLPASVLSPNEEIHVLQIVREALSNAVRHASAGEARIRLDARGERIEVEITDDGVGYSPPADRQRHYGLTIMRERALSLDGELRVRSRPGNGTLVRLSFRPRSAREVDQPPEMLGAA
jgi:two-component system nitrate/nitrite sensor histidine kinase NarX